MKIIRTIIWVVLLIALLIFSVNNWQPVSVKIWEGLVIDTKLPALVLVAFLAGTLPMWLIHLGTRWRLKRRINNLERAALAAATLPVVPPPPPEPITLADSPPTP